jgi:hypothetical protein
MIRTLFLCAILISLSGCGTVFHQPMKTQKDLDRDRQDCEQYLAMNPGPNESRARMSTMKSSSASEGVPDFMQSDDEATCATCEDVKRCLEEQKGWKRVRN